MGDYGYPNYKKPPKGAFSSHDLPDVGDDVWSGANDFDFPQTEAPAPTEGEAHDIGMTSAAAEAFFSQPRRSGKKGG